MQRFLSIALVVAFIVAGMGLGLPSPADAAIPAVASSPATLTPADGWVRTGDMPFGTYPCLFSSCSAAREPERDRVSHSATRLADGRVLVVGGATRGSFGTSLRSLDSAVLYDPATGTWSATASLPEQRARHTATLLPNGKVLVAGGLGVAGSDWSHGSAVLYDPVGGTWSATGTMTLPRSAHTATLLANGKVLVTGGIYGDIYNPSGPNPLAPSAELYDPATGLWTRTGNNMSSARQAHEAVLLRDGRVLVISGMASGNGNYTWSADLYDPATDRFTPTGAPCQARRTFAAALLPDGRVLIANGYALGRKDPACPRDYHALTSAEIWDPATGLWSNTASSAIWHTWTEQAQYRGAVTLPDGRILLTGGVDIRLIDYQYVWLGGSEIYDPATATWSAPETMVSNNRARHTATLLANGTVLAAGGSDLGSGLYQPMPITELHAFGAPVSATSVALTASPANPAFGQPITFTATVTSTGGTPTGTVTFKDGATVLGIGTLSGGVATFTTPSLGVGSHAITATYEGAPSFTTSTSATPVTMSVTKAATTTTLTSSPANPSFGQPITFTATVTSTGGTPTGTVTFRDGTTVLGTGTLAGGIATFTTAALGAGPHAISAMYDGGTSFLSSVTAVPLSQTVTKATTTTALTSSPANPSFGQPITFTATVASTGGTPTGTVTFKDGTTILGTGTLSGGVATFTTSALGVGSHSISATYEGGTSFLSSATAVPLSQTVTKAATTLDLAFDTSLISDDNWVALTVTVRPHTLAGSTVSGTVEFIVTEPNGATTRTEAIVGPDGIARSRQRFEEQPGSYRFQAIFTSTNPNFESATGGPLTIEVGPGPQGPGSGGLGKRHTGGLPDRG